MYVKGIVDERKEKKIERKKIKEIQEKMRKFIE